MSLDALVHHVCDKTSGLIVHIPEVDTVYYDNTSMCFNRVYLCF